MNKFHIFHKWGKYEDVNSWQQVPYCITCNRKQHRNMKGWMHS